MTLSKTKSDSYHHGELRSALINAAFDVLKREGPSALSLRRLAREVGVSPMAPYHHFKDRDALLAAVATAGFKRLQEQKIESASAHENVSDALAAGAANYVHFILDNPSLYRLMRGPEFADSERFRELHEAAAAPAQTLVNLIAELIAEYDLRDLSIQKGAAVLWGLSHGIGTLAVDGQIPQDSAPSLAREGAAAIVSGWLKA